MCVSRNKYPWCVTCRHCLWCYMEIINRLIGFFGTLCGRRMPFGSRHMGVSVGPRPETGGAQAKPERCAARNPEGEDQAP